MRAGRPPLGSPNCAAHAGAAARVIRERRDTGIQRGIVQHRRVVLDPVLELGDGIAVTRGAGDRIDAQPGYRGAAVHVSPSYRRRYR